MSVQRVRRTGVVAVKRGMLGLWDTWGVRHPVTVLQLDDVQVVQAKAAPTDGHFALQLGATSKKQKSTTMPERGHFARAGVRPKRVLVEFPVTSDALVDVGTTINAAHFVPGQYVDVCGYSIGKGFQGPMKRWGFGGLPASHGVSVSHRSHGATGQRQDPGKVFKGKKMAGHMGVERTTMQNLLVFKIDTLLNLVYVRGLTPGHVGAYVRITDAVKMPVPHNAPFPTYLPAVHGPLARELVMPVSELDPMAADDGAE
eukprot:Unigene6615_Nuclearia_a/m.20321 Unigene6615_Nuclearia_a/g.20321  ORF Unigene6615_Nuclearia_a/g.20321 Unigene6615_Nuclearia_a/m.20321 type:complete len:257 (-) Unigene6615_Nuclearia_a:6-776(-)